MTPDIVNRRIPGDRPTGRSGYYALRYLGSPKRRRHNVSNHKASSFNQWVRCVNNDPEFGTKYCRVFRISFYISIISIILSILIILSIADIFKNPPSSIHLENIKNQRMFYIKHLVMPLLAMFLLIIHLIFFIIFNIYLRKIVSIIGKSSAFYITFNVLTMPLGSIYVFFRIRKLAIEKGLWH